MRESLLFIDLYYNKLVDIGGSGQFYYQNLDYYSTKYIITFTISCRGGEWFSFFEGYHCGCCYYYGSIGLYEDIRTLKRLAGRQSICVIIYSRVP
jgi:hypothetical protein